MKVATRRVDKKVDSIAEQYGNESNLLVSVLQDVQSELNYLPAEALKEVSRKLNIPLTQVYSVATFYKAFSLKPRGRHNISCCMGTACHVRGSTRILDTLERELKVKAGETTDDGRFTLETVNCLGACALGPIVVIDGEYTGGMKSEKVKALLKKYE
jgi:NADH-quinone oxidoreductase subunit E